MGSYDDEVRRRAQWKRANKYAVIDRSGVPCSDSVGCVCPACKDWAEMREQAHRFHYLRKVEWAEAWRLAGWGGDGGAPTPFAEPTTVRPSILPPATPRNGNWIDDRFAELFTTSDESTGAKAAAMPASDLNRRTA